MKNYFKSSGILFSLMIFLTLNNFTFAQSVYREPTKETKKTVKNNSTKADENSVFSDEELALIDYYSNPKNKKDVEKSADALENVKPLENNFYSITELALKREEVTTKFKVFETAFGGPTNNSEKVILLENIIKEYKSAAGQVDKAYAEINNYSEKDKKTITTYKDDYSKVLGTLQDILDFTK